MHDHRYDRARWPGRAARTSGVQTIDTATRMRRGAQLEDADFVAVRLLAERDGLSFVEGVKRNA